MANGDQRGAEYSSDINTMLRHAMKCAGQTADIQEMAKDELGRREKKEKTRAK